MSGLFDYPGDFGRDMMRDMRMGMSASNPNANLTGDMLDVLTDIDRKMRDAPPTAHAIMASHKVPLERIYRQWDTHGRLLMWVNTGMLLDSAKIVRSSDGDVTPGSYAWGIPVVRT